jgi:hypothetical protein
VETINQPPTSAASIAILRSSAQVRSNSRQKAPGPFHVCSIAISKASKQILFFGPRSDDEQTEQHDAGHKEEPVCRRQGSPHSEQCGGVVKGMPDPAIGTLYDQGVLLSCDGRSTPAARRQLQSHRPLSISASLEARLRTSPSSLDRPPRRSAPAREQRPRGVTSPK